MSEYLVITMALFDFIGPVISEIFATNFWIIIDFPIIGFILKRNLIAHV